MKQFLIVIDQLANTLADVAPAAHLAIDSEETA